MTVLDVPNIDLDEHKLIASICRDSFFEFVKEFWSEIIDEPFIDNWHIEFLCRELELGAHRVFKRLPKKYDLLINIAPGSTKSTIVSVMFPVWCWTQEQWVQTICGSYAQELSLDLSLKSRTVVLSEKFRKCFPEIVLQQWQHTKTWFVNEKGGWRYSTSTGGAVTGKHGHIIIIDDPVDPQGSKSEAEMKEANDWLTETIPKRKVSQRNTFSIMIMQRLGEKDPSGLWLEWQKKGIPIKHICIPAELRTDEDSVNDVKPQKLLRYYVDGLMDPHRLSWEELRKQKLIGVISYAGQYLQKPQAPGGNMFKTSLFEIISIAITSGWILVRYWDKAGTKDGGAYTVGVLMGRKGKGVDAKYCVFDVVRGQWDAAEREQIILQTAKLDGKGVVVYVEQEPGSGGLESAQATMRRLAGFRVKRDRPTGSKETRADTYAAVVNAGAAMLKKAEWNEEYLKELSYFPDVTYKFKDQVDASSGAFAQLSKPMIKLGAL